MTLPVNQVPVGSSWSHRARVVAAIALLVLGGVVAAVANVAVWARDTALDTDTYLETVVPLADDADLADAVAAYLTDQLFQYLDLEDLAAGALPDEWAGLSELVGPAESAVRPVVEDLVVDVLQSEQVQELWATINREGHELLLEVLEGENEYLSIDGDDIVLDLSPVMTAVEERLGEWGIDVVDVVPDASRRYVVYTAPEVGDAVRAIDDLERLAVWLPVLAVVLLAVGVTIGPRRLRLLGGAGTSVALAALAVLALEAVAQGLVFDQLTEPIAELAGRSLWDVASGRLVGQTCLLVIIGGTVAAFGFGLDFARRNASPTASASASRSSPAQ